MPWPLTKTTLKHGVLLGTYEILNLSPIQESHPPPVAGVKAQDADVTNLNYVMAPLMPHVTVLDYPEVKHTLQLLSRRRQAIVLPELLGVMNKVTYHIAL